MMITQNGVGCFLELAKTLNFTRASENLYMTQQSVSRQIMLLEKSLGFPLFVRTHRTVKLTPEGERFAMLFSRFSSEFSECLTESLKACRLRENRLSVGYESWTEYRTIPAQAHAAARENIADFSLDGELHSPATLLKLLASGRADLVMLFSRFAIGAERFQRLALQTVPLVLLVSRSRYASMESPCFSDFASDPLVVDRKECDSMKYTVGCERLRRCGLSPSQLLVHPNRDSVYLAVELGNGVALDSAMCQTENRAIVKVPTDLEDTLICLWRNDETAILAGLYAQHLKAAFDAQA